MSPTPPAASGAAALRVLVTRPEPQASEWAPALEFACGLQVRALPLLAVAGPEDPSEVRQAAMAVQAGQFQAVVFVSPNAVVQFMAAAAQALPAWPAAVWAAAPGPGTAQALAAAGVPPSACIAPETDAASFDSESLWVRMGSMDWAGARVLVVRGLGGREWLAEQLGLAGAEVQYLSAYRRVPPQWGAEQIAWHEQALAWPHQHLWFFSSSEAISNLLKRSPHTDWAPAQALASHPRIAQRAQAAGFGQVHHTRPPLPDVVRAVRAWAASKP
jgi:uroporphyrinogen-III synthase